MPSINTVKKYLPDSAYHIYNRGVEKRIVFYAHEDYRMYLRYLYEYLSPPELVIKDIVARGKSRENIMKRIMYLSDRKNFAGRIRLLSYCLMPTHYHLLVEQNNERDLTSFMKALNCRYAQYFNRKYMRVGPLCQGIYKARYLAEDSDKLVVANYIHRNPKDITNEIENYKWSSLQYFCGKKAPNWLYSKRMIEIYQNQPSAKAHSSYLAYLKDQPPGGWSSDYV